MRLCLNHPSAHMTHRRRHWGGPRAGGHERGRAVLQVCGGSEPSLIVHIDLKKQKSLYFKVRAVNRHTDPQDPRQSVSQLPPPQRFTRLFSDRLREAAPGSPRTPNCTRRLAVVPLNGPGDPWKCPGPWGGVIVQSHAVSGMSTRKELAKPFPLSVSGTASMPGTWRLLR